MTTVKIANAEECELIALFRRLNARQRWALSRFALRHSNGMPFSLALARLRSELASSGRRA